MATNVLATRRATEATAMMMRWRLVSFTPSSYKDGCVLRLWRVCAGKLRE
jgi:hypothetical protein